MILYESPIFFTAGMHREMHMVNIGWAAHATHHSSEYLNLTTAARQSAFGQFLGWVSFILYVCIVLHVVLYIFFAGFVMLFDSHRIFYLPLALFFPPELYTFHYSANLFLQIWIHTGAVGKTHPIIELIFNTPSHHRVHHARNPEYIDKNFGGALIIWDRMFGTFLEEKTEPVYGLVHPLRTWDVIWGQVHHLVYIYQEASSYTKLKNKIAIVFAAPGWTISEKTNTWIPSEIPPVDHTQKIYKTQLPNKITTYLLMFMANKFPMLDALLLTAYLIFCVQCYGLILDKSANAFKMEVARTALDLFVAIYFIRNTRPQSTSFLIGSLLCYTLSVLWLVRLRGQFRTFGTKQKLELRQQKEEVTAGVGKQ